MWVLCHRPPAKNWNKGRASRSSATPRTRCCSTSHKAQHQSPAIDPAAEVLTPAFVNPHAIRYHKTVDTFTACI